MLKKDNAGEKEIRKKEVKGENAERTGQNSRILQGKLNQIRNQLLNIRFVAHLYLHGDAHTFVDVGQIADDIADQILIGNDDFGSSQGFQHGIARGNAGNRAGRTIIKRNQIFQLHRSIQQQNEAADVVAGNFLQPEAQPNNYEIGRASCRERV